MSKYDAKPPACFSKKPEGMNRKRLWPKCAHCGDTIDPQSSYFQDIPGLGDLCKPCHVEWRKKEESND